MREQPYYKRPEVESVFKDSQGRSCKVRNKEIYDYSNPEEPIFKLSDDAVALAFLETRCVGLDLSSLKPRKAPDSSESEMIPAGEEAELPVRPDDTVSIRSGSGSAY